MWACDHLNVEVAGMLLDKGADIRAENKDGDTALSLTARSLVDISGVAPDQLIKLLLARGADRGMSINHRDPHGQTLLMIATLANDADRVKSLLAQHAEVDARNEEGESALWLALLKGYPEIARSLLEKGANPRIRNERGVTALMQACSHNRMAPALLDHVSMLDDQDMDGMTAMMYAARSIRHTWVRLLVEHGANVNTPDKRGMTALYYATGAIDTENMEYLLTHGAEVDAATTGGSTPLFSTVIQQAAEAFQVLVKHGANVNAKMTNGETPLSTARRYNSTRMLALLEAAGAKE